MTLRSCAKFILCAALVVAPLLPFVTQAAIVPPCASTAPNCTLNDLVQLANNIMTFLIRLTVAIFVVGIAIVGFKFITANGNPGEISKAKGMLWPMLWGFLLILCAFLLVKLLLSVLAKPEFSRYVSMIYSHYL